MVGVDLAPVATRSRGTGRGGSDRWGGGVGRPAVPVGSGGPKPKWCRAFSLSPLLLFFFSLITRGGKSLSGDLNGSGKNVKLDHKSPVHF